MTKTSTAKAPARARKTQAKPAPAAQARKPGAVAKEVTKLLLGKSTLSYATIAERVKAKVEGASTTPRSVASMAAALRKQGHEIADRRAHA